MKTLLLYNKNYELVNLIEISSIVLNPYIDNNDTINYPNHYFCFNVNFDNEEMIINDKAYFIFIQNIIKDKNGTLCVNIVLRYRIDGNDEQYIIKLEDLHKLNLKF